MLKLIKLNRSRDGGFTLIELAIVLVIIGVLAGTFLGTLGSRIDTTRRAEAVKEMEIIKQALYGYAISQTNPHLPCPDCRSFGCAGSSLNLPNDGKEDRNSLGACRVNGFPGNIPWVTLGVGAGDPWHNRYSYWVSSRVVGDGSSGFLLSDNLATTATRGTVRTRIGTGTPEVSNNVVAIVMSHGKNGYGIISTQNKMTSAVPVLNLDEAENLDGIEPGVSPDPAFLFISRSPTDPTAATPGGEFDDMLIWISEYELKAKMVEAGKLP